MTLVAKELTTAASIAEVADREFVDIPAQSTYDLFRLIALCNPEGKALTFLATASPDSSVHIHTFKELFQRITQAANLFYRLGIDENDVVALMLPIVPEAYFALWGAETAGIALPINFMLSVESIAQMLNIAKAKVLVAYGPHPDFDIWNKANEILPHVPTLTTILQVDPTGENAKSTKTFMKSLSLEPADKLCSQRVIARNDIAAFFHTGGTTGAPKLARLSHGNQIFTAWGCRWMFDYCSGEKIINGFPLFHVAGSLDFGLSPLYAGMEVILPTSLGMRNPEVIANHWKLVECYRVSILAGVLTSIAAINTISSKGSDISSAKCWITGGSPLPAALAAAFEKRFKIPIREVFGMTESSGIAVITPRHGHRKPGAAGMATPLTEIKVVAQNSDVNQAALCKVGEPGMVLMRGPHIFMGYTDQNLNHEIFTENGWLITGDLGFLDKEGYLFLTGRSKDVIIRGGHNIDPLIIETAAMKHPDISIAAAVGQPDSYAGEIPVLFVTPKSGCTIDTISIKTFVGNRVGEPQARPKNVYFLDPMPMTAIGKVYKPALRILAANRVFEVLLQELARIKVESRFEQKRGMVLRITGANQQDHETVKHLLAPFNVFCEFNNS